VQVRLAEVRPTEVRPAAVRPNEGRPAEVRPAEVSRGEVYPVEVRIAEVQGSTPLILTPLIPRRCSLADEGKLFEVSHLKRRYRAADAHASRGRVVRPRRPLRPRSDVPGCDIVVPLGREPQ
jgi:hypothetical protein